MTQSTPLEKIDNDESPDNGSDSERVQRIIQEMNRGGADSPGEPESHQQMYQQQAPPQYQQAPPQYQHAPPQYQQAQQQMNYQMYQPPNMMPPQQLMGHGMMPYPQQEHEHEAREEKPVAPTPVAKKNMWAHITDALKMPFVVACVFFVLSLPVVDLYLSKYAHWAFSSGGQLSLAGIGLKAVAAASIIGVYDTVDNLISRFL